MLSELTARFPGICEIADDGKTFPSDVAVLTELHDAHPQPRDFVEAVHASDQLQCKPLMQAISFPLAAVEAADWVGGHLEADIQNLSRSLGLHLLQNVFRSKLLARTDNQWTDAIHEVAVAATALAFFDDGTLELEKTIPGSANNSDTYGLRKGVPFRIDATVVHDTWPPPSAPGSTIRAFTRNTMDVAETEDILSQNPPGVITSAQVPPTDKATHSSTPLSTKVWQALQAKLKQCEQGCTNVIAVGLPRPRIDDRGAEDAVLGVLYAQVNRDTGKTEWVRHGTGPFVPAEHSHDVATWVDPFRVMSAVWLTRWHAGYPLSKLLANPNAIMQLPSDDADALMQVGMQRASRR